MEKSYSADENLEPYVLETFRPTDPVLAEIRERAAANGLADIHVGPMDALHLEVIARSISARKIVEIGTLAGLSGVALARALPANGRLYTFEKIPKNAKIAQESFHKAGLSTRVQIIVGMAAEKLREIENEGPFDLLFLDADKPGYSGYLEWGAKHLRLGGVVLADNTFAWGLIIEKNPQGEDAANARALQAFNKSIATDPRFRATILPTGMGLTMAVKIKEG